jgi:polygalacturonase
MTTPIQASLARVAVLLALAGAPAAVTADAGVSGGYVGTRFGAKGDGATNDAPAIQRAIDPCTKAGGGRVVLPAGRTYAAGTFVLKDGIVPEPVPAGREH